MMGNESVAHIWCKHHERSATESITEQIGFYIMKINGVMKIERKKNVLQTDDKEDVRAGLSQPRTCSSRQELLCS